MGTDEWFLTQAESGNAATRLPAWSEGNLAEPLVHGAEYFDRLVTEVEQLREGDQLFFTDWRGDPDQRLRDDGPTVGELLGGAARRGVCVRGLVWRSHTDKLRFSAEEHRALDKEVEGAGGEIILDQRVRLFGSHHQKLVVVRHAGDARRDVAFAGGIDLCHSRRDDASHRGDPQAVAMADAYGERPPWHDVQLQVRGPAVGVLDDVFRERWEDPTNADSHNPLAYLLDRLDHARLEPTPLPPRLPDPPACGPHAVQTLRTYPRHHPPYPFAPRGERSVARGYSKAVRRARRLIYLEDQYMWSAQVAELFAGALRDNPGLHLVIVVPRVPDQDGPLELPPNAVGRQQALEVCRRAGADRVHVFDVENHDGVPVYVHAKVCVVDDTWASVGSDNFNRRSWTHDSELSNAVLGGTFAPDLRLRLAREHLDLPPDPATDDGLLDPGAFVAAMEAGADALDAWYAGGRRGPRPPGRLRHHRPEAVGRLARLWATPVYQVFYDPDGRPRSLRRSGAW
jgi:phosphatidylserine/phosphatidylglycerophosphate/cardiolipin synthase-like enzyme